MKYTALLSLSLSLSATLIPSPIHFHFTPSILSLSLSLSLSLTSISFFVWISTHLPPSTTHHLIAIRVSKTSSFTKGGRHSHTVRFIHKMKITAKPISSPGRAEKFPPPLMRFLRTNVGSRSRGRSKSSPMFLKKRGSTAIETQEPTSPKVTCMGQVRVSRSKKKPDPTRKPPRLPKKPCFSIPPLFCPRYKWKKLKPKCSISAWFKWVSCCRVVSGRKVESREDSMRKDLSPVNKRGDNYTLNKKREDSVEEEDEDDQEEEVRVYESSCFTTPPKNALLLTRCRSAPYRSSSLASRFWDSPLKDEGNTEQENKAPLVGDNKVLNLEEEEESNPMSRKDSENDEEEKERFLKGIESTIRERMIKSANDKKECEEEGGGREEEEEEEDGSVSRRPLILTRCKSEPARTASKKLDPEMNFWRKRRQFGLVRENLYG